MRLCNGQAFPRVIRHAKFNNEKRVSAFIVCLNIFDIFYYQLLVASILCPCLAGSKIPIRKLSYG